MVLRRGRLRQVEIPSLGLVSARRRLLLHRREALGVCVLEELLFFLPISRGGLLLRDGVVGGGWCGWCSGFSGGWSRCGAVDVG